MPIKPEHRDRYPADWNEIRAKVLNRAGLRCELCGAEHLDWIARRRSCAALWISLGQFKPLIFPERANQKPEDFLRPVRVILTIAHLDPTYGSSDPKHLLALCQRCHLKIDAHVHSQARKLTREGKIIELRLAKKG